MAITGLAHQCVADARAVLKYSPELAGAVMQGEKPLQAALTETRHSQGGVRNMRRYVCSRFELSRRRDNLSFSHHREVAVLDPGEQANM